MFASRRTAHAPALAIAIVLALSAAAVTIAAHQAPKFTGGTDAILVDVSVTRSGAAVEGLTAADFTVRDSGVPQSVQLIANDGLPVSLLLAFDTSASVRGPALDHLKDAAKAAIGSLRPGDEAALLTFSHNVLLRSGWTSSRETLTKAIDGLNGQGLTALTDAAFAALTMSGKPLTRRLVLLFTDGDDTSSWTSAADLLQTARRSDAVVYSVSVDSTGHSGAAITRLLEGRPKNAETTRMQLDQWLAAEPRLYRGALVSLLALETGGEPFRAAETSKLSATFVDIVSRFSRRYVLAYTPTGVPPTGWHPIEVEVKGGGDLSARRGYQR